MIIIPKKHHARPGGARGREARETASDTALRPRGLRLTNPRRVVLEVVRGTESRATAAGVHRAVRRRLPRVSLGTVYRNLRLLVAEGLVQELMGIDAGAHVWLQIGRELAVAGEFEAGHSDGEKGKLAAVHFVGFRLSEEARRAFSDAPIFLVVDHPAERTRTPLGEETRAALLQDLRG